MITVHEVPFFWLEEQARILLCTIHSFEAEEKAKV